MTQRIAIAIVFAAYMATILAVFFAILWLVVCFVRWEIITDPSLWTVVRHYFGFADRRAHIWEREPTVIAASLRAIHRSGEGGE